MIRKRKSVALGLILAANTAACAGDELQAADETELHRGDAVDAGESRTHVRTNPALSQRVDGVRLLDAPADTSAWQVCGQAYIYNLVYGDNVPGFAYTTVHGIHSAGTYGAWASPPNCQSLGTDATAPFWELQAPLTNALANAPVPAGWQAAGNSEVVVWVQTPTPIAALEQADAEALFGLQDELTSAMGNLLAGGQLPQPNGAANISRFEGMVHTNAIGRFACVGAGGS